MKKEYLIYNGYYVGNNFISTALYTFNTKKEALKKYELLKLNLQKNGGVELGISSTNKEGYTEYKIIKKLIKVN